MNTAIPMKSRVEKSWHDLAAELGARFAAAAADHDAGNAFVHDNYTALREHGLFRLCIPRDLGGGGASYAEIPSRPTPASGLQFPIFVLLQRHSRNWKMET